MLTADDILGALAEHRERIRSLGVRRIGVFGSFARGEEHEESDIDILIEFKEGAPLTRTWTSNSSSKISSGGESTSSTAMP